MPSFLKNNFLHKLAFFIACFSPVFFMSCSTGTQGEYADPEGVEIIDDRWNETDARKVAESFVKAILEKAWLNNFEKEHGGKKPIVVVNEINNETSELLNTNALTREIQNNLINSGRIRFIDKEFRDALDKEVNRQQNDANMDKSKTVAAAKRIGAHFMVSGALSSQEHYENKLKSVSYQANLQVTSLETEEIVFSDMYKIKKRFKTGKVRR